MTTPIFDLAGSRYEIGFAHGKWARERVRAFAGDGLFRLNHLLYEPVSLDGLKPTIRAYHDVIAADLPEFVEEIEGLAAGAEISYEEAMLLQIRREVLGYRKVPSRGDCTTFARTDGSGRVLAQTIDLNGNLEDQAYVLRIDRTGAGGVLVFTFTGLLGYLGVNGHGLAIGLNLVLGGDWRPGIPAYMAIRHLLDTATCIDDCMERLAALRLASSRSFTLCDGSRIANVEMLDNELKWSTPSEVVHTNHFLDPGFARRDEMNVFAKNSSVLRLETCKAALAGMRGDEDAEGYFSVLAQHPVCVHSDGDIRREATVAAVVMRPDRGEMHVRKGYPCTGRTETIALRSPEFEGAADTKT